MTATTARPTPAPSARRDRTAPWRHIDVALLVSVAGILATGLVMIYSSTHRRLEEQGLSPFHYVSRQGIGVAVGVAALIAAASIDYRVLRDRAIYFYAATIAVLLVVVSPLGRNAKGSQAWLQLGPFQFQPSEAAKVVIVLFLASYCATHRGELGVKAMLTVLAIVGLPMALIQLQPDLGTNLVFGAILMAVLLVAGARPKHLAVLVLAGVAATIAVYPNLKDYQRDRLTAFVDPENDAQRSTYNLNQSKIAIGSGGITGKGLFQGTQTNLSYVPEQHTDFIFTVVGEELGLLGSVVLLMLFAVVVWRTWRAATLARDLSGTLICIGVLAMFVFQIFENIGMTMGIMPITGIPLPFMSYGGSACIASMAAIGLVVNVNMRRFS